MRNESNRSLVWTLQPGDYFGAGHGNCVRLTLEMNTKCRQMLSADKRTWASTVAAGGCAIRGDRKSIMRNLSRVEF